MTKNRFSESEVKMPCRDATSWDRLLDICGKYLHLSRPAKRLFGMDGIEIVDYEQLENGMELYVSEGEECQGKVVLSNRQRMEKIKAQQLEEILSKANSAKPRGDKKSDHEGMSEPKKKKKSNPRMCYTGSGAPAQKPKPKQRPASSPPISTPVTFNEPAEEEVPISAPKKQENTIGEKKFKLTGLTMHTFDGEN